MPLKPEPYDREYVNHQPGAARPLGKHVSAGKCGAKTELEHDNPYAGPMKWKCTREAGHMGRHEAGQGEDTEYIYASWAPRIA